LRNLRVGLRFFRQEPKMTPQLDGDVVIHRAGVGLLFCDSELRQQIEDLVRFDLELPRQFVNSDLAHIVQRVPLSRA
jgi:hypothetical protein